MSHLLLASLPNPVGPVPDSPVAISYPLLGLILVAAALVLATVIMVLVRACFRRFRVAEKAHGPVLEPENAAIKPEVIAAITAAVVEMGDPNATIVSITPVQKQHDVGALHPWSGEGRRDHFASHKVR